MASRGRMGKPTAIRAAKARNGRGRPPRGAVIAELRPHTGQDAAVRDYVLSRDGAEDYLATYHRLLDLTTAGYRREGKRYMTIAVGCTGGKHRSVAMAEALAARLEQAPDLTVNVVHRDLGRE